MDFAAYALALAVAAPVVYQNQLPYAWDAVASQLTQDCFCYADTLCDKTSGPLVKIGTWKATDYTFGVAATDDAGVLPANPRVYALFGQPIPAIAPTTPPSYQATAPFSLVWNMVLGVAQPVTQKYKLAVQWGGYCVRTGDPDDPAHRILGAMSAFTYAPQYFQLTLKDQTTFAGDFTVFSSATGMHKGSTPRIVIIKKLDE